MGTDPVRAFLGLLKDVKASGTDQWMARCPAHDDKNPSLSIGRGDNGQVLLKCFSGCSPESIVAAAHTTMSDLFVETDSGRLERHWDIRDMEGKLIAAHWRADSPGEEKKIWWEKDGTKGLKKFGIVNMPLYGTELLKELPDGATVVLCEGEKATDAVRAAGFVAVGTVCGAATTPVPQILTHLSRFDLVFWPDNDIEGRKHMDKIAKVLEGASIRWVSWQDAPDKGDAADTTRERIAQLVRSAQSGEATSSSLVRELIEEDLTAPLVTKRDRTVTVEWIAKQVKAEARGLKEHSDGRIAGHLSIETTLPGTARSLRAAQFTFTALRSRTELATDLAKKVSELNWDQMIEFLCSVVTTYVQGGEPVEDILAGQQVAATRFALWPLLIEHHPVILFGQEGTAKSYLALLITYLAVSGSKEAEALGLRIDAPLKSLLYLDWEGTGDVVRERLNMLQRGMNLPTVPFQYRRCTRPLFSDVDAIKASVKGTPDLIIVDSLIPAAGGDPSSPQVANELFTALRSFGATSLLIGHAPKHTANTAGASVFGSGVFQFLTRSLWEIRRDQEDEEDTILVGLVHKKMNYGRRERPLGFRFTFSPDSVAVTREDVAALPSMESARSLTTRIVHHLTENGKQSPKQMSEALGVEQNKISATLTYLRGKHLVARLDRGYWGALVADHEAKDWSNL
jgi:hypothetical protein